MVLRQNELAGNKRVMGLRVERVIGLRVMGLRVMGLRVMGLQVERG
jgi:hypothetical protein